MIIGHHSARRPPIGCGYQWWIPKGDAGETTGEFSATGVYNHFVDVDPSREVVIVKLSANRTYVGFGPTKQ